MEITVHNAGEAREIRCLCGVETHARVAARLARAEDRVLPDHVAQIHAAPHRRWQRGQHAGSGKIDGPPSAEAIGWAKVYAHRFPDPDIQKLLAQAPSLSYNYLGGLPPY